METIYSEQQKCLNPQEYCGVCASSQQGTQSAGTTFSYFEQLSFWRSNLSLQIKIKQN
jgi:hypothetical protein